MKITKIIFNVKDTDLKKLKARAKAEFTSVSAIIRSLIDKYLK